MSKAMKAAAVAVFAQHPEASECFVTEDAQAFLNESYAAHHARQSRMPEPVRFKRDQVSAVVMSAEDNAQAEDTEAKEQAEAKAKAEAEAAKAKVQKETKTATPKKTAAKAKGK